MRIQKPGIEWTGGLFGAGATLNPIQGCAHGCEWNIGGKRVGCYAHAMADRFGHDARDGQSGFFENGFEAHYWHPERLLEPERIKRRLGIFVDSMSDMYGAQVPDFQIRAIHAMCRRAGWHVFFSLTKNPARMAVFGGEMPVNLWSGFSSPPDVFEGRALTAAQRQRMFEVGMKALSAIQGGVRWASLEPLTFDCSRLLGDGPLDWVVIGAASDGRRFYQPEVGLLRRTLDALDARDIPVFMKGNLRPSLGLAFDQWREEYPPVPEFSPAL